MSNHLGIATVTATLRHLLHHAVGTDVPGATASAVRPDDPAAADPGVNIFLYQVTPNTAWRNEDLPTRNGSGRGLQRPRAAIDLHYLLTVKGTEATFEPQRVLGSVVRELHAKPVLTRPQIEAVLAGVLASSDLATEAELVKLTQLPLTLEELSKLWSVFFQAKYQLSVAYQGSVVLIEPEDSFSSPLPVRARNIYLETFREPLIESVVAHSGADQPILAGAQVRIRGRRLAGIENVRVDGTLATPGSITDTEVTATLPATLPPEPPDPPKPFPAGIHGITVERTRKMGIPEVPHAPSVRSNVLPFVLAPSLSSVTAAAGVLHAVVEPPVATGQRALLMLNQTTDDPHAYTFTATGTGANPLSVPVAGVMPGTYLVRVRVDGATSPLNDTFTGPQVTL